jgi:hypothetical protein
VSWNCNGAFRKKFEAIAQLEADLYVIQECENPDQCSDDAYRQWAKNHLWTGQNKNKGLGVFASPRVKLERIALDLGRLELFLPVRVNSRLHLLATWTRQANSPTFGYIGQL